MKENSVQTKKDYCQLQQLISGPVEGIILIDSEQTILWAKDAARAMHGVPHCSDLGADIDACRRRFGLTYRDKHPFTEGDPIERVIAGEAVRDVTIEVANRQDEHEKGTGSKIRKGGNRQGQRRQRDRSGGMPLAPGCPGPASFAFRNEQSGVTSNHPGFLLSGKVHH
jgi:PAS domain-containing protein